MEATAFGEVLRALRAAAHLSQEELAERARLSPGAISALERGVRRAPQHQTLALLAEGLRLQQADRERLETAAVAGRRRGARAASAETPQHHNVPSVPTSFHGRERELAEVEQLTRTRRIITLLGTGGVGKTRLALEAARALLESDRFPDGIWFVDLGPLDAADLVAGTIAHVAAIRERPGEAVMDTVAAAFAAKSALVILDNCEHLLAACAHVTERLTRDCPNVVVIATTREALRAEGECVLRVEPLRNDGDRSTPALDMLLDRLADADFVRFSAFSPDDRAHAAAVCDRLDGIPLALELAAGRARDVPLAHIVSGLDERFTLLSSGRRTATPRQQTLRGMIEWSYVQLSADEQRVFCRLGLFAGSFTPEAATDVCGEKISTVRDALAGLIAKSLVTVVDDAGAPMRYRMLETVRAYALERLRDDPDADAAAARFARTFLAFAKGADARYGRTPNDAFFAWVEPEIDNVRAALTWSLAQRNDVTLGAELAGSLGWVYRQTALFSEGIRWCERALADGMPLRADVAGRLHMALSFFYFNTGRLQDALEAAERATGAYRDANRMPDLTWSLTQQAYCLYLLGRGDEARDAVANAVVTARAQDDPLRLAGALNALAITIPIERAAERFAPLEEAIRAYREAGDTAAIVPTANLAETHYATGNFSAALAAGRDVVAMTRKGRDRSNLAAALTNVAAYALAMGDVEQADDAVREALGLMRDLGKTLNAMCALQHLGTIAARRGDYVRAARLIGASDRLYAEFGLTREFTEQALYAQTVAALRDALGDAALRRYTDDGGDSPLDGLIAEALDAA